MTRGALRRFRSWKGAERGASAIAIFILTLPLLIALFGFAFDTIRLVYARNYIQGRLDLAVGTASAETFTNYLGGTRLGMPGGEEIAADLADAYYVANTRAKRSTGNNQPAMLMCPEDNLLFDGTAECSANFSIVYTNGRPSQGFDFCADPSTGELYGVEGRVTERIHPVFLSLVGLDDYVVTLRSTAPLRGGNC